MARSGVAARGHDRIAKLASGLALSDRRRAAALKRCRLPQWTGRAALVVVVAACASVAELSAHGVSGKDALFLQGIHGAAIGPLMYLGAKHMVTGYDHLAFLVGVVFFLYRIKDVVST